MVFVKYQVIMIDIADEAIDQRAIIGVGGDDDNSIVHRPSPKSSIDRPVDGYKSRDNPMLDSSYTLDGYDRRTIVFVSSYLSGGETRG
jgi:hypothetical protein